MWFITWVKAFWGVRIGLSDSSLTLRMTASQTIIMTISQTIIMIQQPHSHNALPFYFLRLKMSPFFKLYGQLIL